MKNLLNIDDKVKVVLQGEGKENVIGNSEVVTVTNIDKFPDGTIYYIGSFHVNCSEGGEGYDTTIQFKEGEYQKADELFNYKELSLLMGLVVRNSVELQAKLDNKNYESDLEKYSLESELKSINDIGAKISAKINK